MSLTTLSRQPRGQAESGFSLIEVMVTILIVSFGLLGLAGMLFSSVTAGQTSMARSIAVNLANEMGDRVRSNWKGIKAGAFNDVKTTDYADLSGGCVTTCMMGSCSPSDLAKLDVCLWKAQVQKQLPAGSASITVDPVNNSCASAEDRCVFTVTVNWNESAYKTGTADPLFLNAQTSYSVQVQP